ncbi:MAG: glycosyltransferase [Candidatus Omnitrophica bacterium]|nr:glycosyltransferase [Candidatus Omnitrophota bacterium]
MSYSIVLVNRWFPPHSGYGGIAMCNYYLSKALVKKGHRVTIVASRCTKEIPEIEEREGIAVHRIYHASPYWPTRLFLVGRFFRTANQLFYSFKVSQKLKKLERTIPIDCIEFAEVEGEGFFHLLRKKRHPVLVRCHTPIFILKKYYAPSEMPFSTAVIEWMEKYCICRADGITAPSGDMMRVILSVCSSKNSIKKVIPNSLDLKMFETARLTQDKTEYSKVDPEGKLTGKKIVLYVGRLERVKGIEVLKNAISKVCADVKNIHFVIIGEDRYYGEKQTQGQRMKQYFKNAGLEAQVTCVGFVDQETLLQWYRRADLAVVPSLIYESFSYTCAQAAAMGIPVVASRIGGIAETVEDQVTGILVKPDHGIELSEAIIRLASDAKMLKNMGVAGFERMSRLYDHNKVADDYLDFVTEVVSLKTEVRGRVDNETASRFKFAISMLDVPAYKLYGGKTFSQGIMKGFAEMKKPFESVIMASNQNGHLWKPFLDHRMKLTVIPTWEPAPLWKRAVKKLLRGFAREESVAKMIEKDSSIGAVLYPSPDIDRSICLPSIVVVHDLIYEYIDEFKTRHAKRKQYREAVTHADAIIAPADHTKKTIMETYGIEGNKIYVVPYGVDSGFFTRKSEDEVLPIRSKYKIHKPYLFYPAGFWPHKNHRKLFEAVAILKKKDQWPYQLVLSGSLEWKESAEKIKSGMRELGLSENVVILGEVLPRELPVLYSGAEAMIYPSIFEGFGLVLFEAMACQCLVLYSSATTLPEVAGNVGLPFDPNDAESISDAIWRMSQQGQGWKQKQRDLGLARAKSFTWEKTADAILEVVEQTSMKMNRAKTHRDYSL